MVRAPETSDHPRLHGYGHRSPHLGKLQAGDAPVADSGIIVCPCHYYLVSTLFQDIPKQKRNVQIQLILRETAEGTSGSGGSLGLHGGVRVRFCGAHINIFTLMSGIDSDDMAVVAEAEEVSLLPSANPSPPASLKTEGLVVFWLFSASGAR